MITKCRFCDYSRETPLSIPILEQVMLAEKQNNYEDQVLWMERLFKTAGFKDYNSVKIHMGIKHKEDTYKYISPNNSFSKAEAAVINSSS